MAQLNSAAQLNANASVSATQAPPSPINTVCPPPSRMFHGRRDILDKLHAYFLQDIGRRHVSVLHGLGGAGKTQICLKFMDESDKSRFTDVFFLDASTVDTIKSGLKNIALTRSIGSEADDASLWLASSQDEWLLIFDNADDPSIDLFNYFPQSSRGNILITSRNPELYVHAPDSHHRISDMEEEDAVGLLLASAMQSLNTETESLARDIVKALYCFPLAVVQAGAFIARTGTLRKYLTMFEQNRAQLLSRVPSQSHDKYAWSVYTTWDISFKCLSPMAAKFLQICSFLHHEGISEAIFSSAAAYEHDSLGPTEEQIEEPLQFLNHFVTQAGSWDDLHFTDITTEIKGYSLINQDPNTNLFSIHPLVHDWSKKTIRDTNSTRECSAAILAMTTMSTLHDQVFHISLLPHLNSVLCGEAQVAHKFAHPFQHIFYDAGHFDHSRELCVALLENRKHTLGDEHSDTLGAMSSLAAVCWKLGKGAEALELDVAVLEKRKEILGLEHPHTLDAMLNLAITYHDLGKLTESEELNMVVLEKRKQILGLEHPKTLAAMSSLAVTYHNLGKLTDTEDLKVVVLEKRKQILGPDHPETLYSMLNLAVTYSSLGKLTDAEELEVVVLEKRRQILGTEHPDTLHAMSGLAVTYHSLGKLPDAEDLKEVVLEKQKQIMGPDHPATLHAMSELAVTYQALGKLTDAEELYVVLLDKQKQILGTEHPDTLAVMSSLAATYWQLDKFMDAEALDIAVLEKRKQLFGTEHPDTLASMTDLALTYKKLGNFTEAEHLLLTVLEKRTSNLGPEHKETLTAQEKLTELRRHIELQISPDST
ncbi:P-loop containing nucleoside triphosphate hydrolase protein [Mycena rebaudengoi]|nr:P-loop containing nucleoside triphosphate hydrolase protein [Mycena rebaudengoi]